MTTRPLLIRDFAAPDEAEWRRLWDGYTTFYDVVVDPDVTDGNWRRITEIGGDLIGRVAVRDGRVVGFSHSVLQPSTWMVGPDCYLEDLFVDPAERGQGIGRALIQDLIELGRGRGWSRLYWHTQADNAAARRLYDQFIAADDFVRYRIALGPR